MSDYSPVRRKGGGKECVIGWKGEEKEVNLPLLSPSGGGGGEKSSYSSPRRVREGLSILFTWSIGGGMSGPRARGGGGGGIALCSLLLPFDRGPVSSS